MRAKSREYIKDVVQQAEGSHPDPLYVGDHLQDLSDYLKRARSPKRRAQSQHDRWEEQKTFLRQYDLQHELVPKAFSDVVEYEKSLDDGKLPDRATLLFLTGYPSPEWLAAIGGEFNPDAFALMEHMRFLPSARLPSYVTPSFNKAGNVAIRLSITTVGHVDPPLDAFTSKDLQQQRRSASLHLSQASRPAAGSSIVRRFALHDTNRFSLEQDVTMIYRSHENRWSLLVFYDSGGNEEDEIVLSRLPAYEDRRLALVHVLWQTKDDTPSTGEPKNHQASKSSSTASRLPAHYGRTLNKELLLQDPFYALHELFELTAQAELQFLNMMWNIVTSQLDLQGAARIDVVEHERQGTPLLADFHHSRDILGRHIQRLKESVQLLRDRELLSMPMSSDPNLKSIAEQARTDLLYRFNLLIDRAQTLVERCERGADLAMNNTSLQLAERAFGYSKSIGKLTTVGTWVAVLFVPLALVTSIFGMNFTQFGTGKLSLWVFAAVAGPILILSLTALLWKKAWFWLEKLTYVNRGREV